MKEKLLLFNCLMQMVLIVMVFSMWWRMEKEILVIKTARVTLDQLSQPDVIVDKLSEKLTSFIAEQGLRGLVGSNHKNVSKKRIKDSGKLYFDPSTSDENQGRHDPDEKFFEE